MNFEKTGTGVITLLFCCLLAACITPKQQGGQRMDPAAQNTKLTGSITFTANSRGNRPLPGSPYGYEMWTQGGNDNKLIWFGPDQGGGAAFRAEWNNPNDFLGRIGFFWGNGGQYTEYKNMYADL